MSLKEHPLPSIASLRAVAALRSPYLALVRPARIGLGFESAGINQKTLAEVETLLGGPGRLALPYSLCWLLDVMSGLGVLHRTFTFVHGEIQPEHIVLGDDGVGRLVPVVRAHWVRGEQRAPARLYYLAPEKLLGDAVDVRSDVYSLGVLLWEALAGQPMLAVQTVDEIIARLMSGGVELAQPREAELWAVPLADIAQRAIALDPGRRFASVGVMRDALHSACSRYLASPPGMAALFQNPELRVRGYVRDSLPPESQRATLPPAQPGVTPRAAAASVDLEEEITSKSHPLPQLSGAQHVQTLLGVPGPFVDRESSPDMITQPFAKIPSSALYLITPLPTEQTAAPVPPLPPSASVPAPWLAPSAVSAPPAPGRSATLSGPPPQLSRASSSPPSTNASVGARRPVSLAPLVAAPPAVPQAIPEPSFELVRPRRRRGVPWLLLGAAVAIGAFAARPWLTRWISENSSDAPDLTATPTGPNAAATADQPSGTAQPATELSARAVGIASTPATPNATATPRGRGVSREEHVVIHDSLEPQRAEPATPSPVERKPEPPAAPTSAPPPPTTSSAKTKPLPVSDADRYGI